MSRVPALIDACVALFKADAGLSGAVVVDGPQVTAEQADDWVLVGYDGDANGSFQAATSTQNWAGLGTRRGESIALTVAVVARRGDTDVKAARDRVYALAGRIETVFRLNPSAALPELQVAVETGTLMQDQTPDGVQARLLLTLNADAFI